MAREASKIVAASILTTILAFAGWFMWGIYSGVIATPVQLTSDAATYSYVGFGVALSFSPIAIVFWAWAVAITSSSDWEVLSPSHAARSTPRSED